MSLREEVRGILSNYVYQDKYIGTKKLDQATDAILKAVEINQCPEERCKYSSIGHGIDSNGDVTEIKYYCSINPEADYTDIKSRLEGV